MRVKDGRRLMMVLAMVDAGHSVSAIAEKTGYSEATINRRRAEWRRMKGDVAVQALDLGSLDAWMREVDRGLVVFDDGLDHELADLENYLRESKP